jgi:NadR type nicotinamide-nucleotide adenylyltransferase
MTTRGLVVGKFYPPHRGHKLLIDAALAGADEVDVVVCDRPGEDPPATLRAAWLREIHPAARVHVVDDRYDADDSAVWAEACTNLLGSAPDVVFTSEDYGDRFAACLGCRHVLVDKTRRTMPVSGTAVRADPLGCWEYLEPSVRGYYAKRVVLIGAESTGKTSLAADLAAAFDTVWVPEYGREHWEGKLARGEPHFWRADEFAEIARGQCEREDAAARLANRVLVCDTDAFATRVWHHRYLDSWSPEVDAIVAARRRPDLYLLTDVATPFVQDGTRDGELVRERMHRVLVEELRTDRQPFVELAGTRAERLAAASAEVRRVMAEMAVGPAPPLRGERAGLGNR